MPKHLGPCSCPGEKDKIPMAIDMDGFRDAPTFGCGSSALLAKSHLCEARRWDTRIIAWPNCMWIHSYGATFVIALLQLITLLSFWRLMSLRHGYLTKSCACKAKCRSMSVAISLPFVVLSVPAVLFQLESIYTAK